MLYKNYLLLFLVTCAADIISLNKYWALHSPEPILSSCPPGPSPGRTPCWPLQRCSQTWGCRVQGSCPRTCSGKRTHPAAQRTPRFRRSYPNGVHADRDWRESEPVASVPWTPRPLTWPGMMQRQINILVQRQNFCSHLWWCHQRSASVSLKYICLTTSMKLQLWGLLKAAGALVREAKGSA